MEGLCEEAKRLIRADEGVIVIDADGKNKNDHFRDVVRAAVERIFEPGCVIFNSWYSSIDNLKLIRYLK